MPGPLSDAAAAAGGTNGSRTPKHVDAGSANRASPPGALRRSPTGTPRNGTGTASPASARRSPTARESRPLPATSPFAQTREQPLWPEMGEPDPKFWNSYSAQLREVLYDLVLPCVTCWCGWRPFAAFPVVEGMRCGECTTVSTTRPWHRVQVEDLVRRGVLPPKVPPRAAVRAVADAKTYHPRPQLWLTFVREAARPTSTIEPVRPPSPPPAPVVVSSRPRSGRKATPKSRRVVTGSPRGSPTAPSPPAPPAAGGTPGAGARGGAGGASGGADARPSAPSVSPPALQAARAAGAASPSSPAGGATGGAAGDDGLGGGGGRPPTSPVSARELKTVRAAAKRAAHEVLELREQLERAQASGARQAARAEKAEAALAARGAGRPAGKAEARMRELEAAAARQQEQLDALTRDLEEAKAQAGAAASLRERVAAQDAELKARDRTIASLQLALQAAQGASAPDTRPDREPAPGGAASDGADRAGPGAAADEAQRRPA